MAVFHLVFVRALGDRDRLGLLQETLFGIQQHDACKNNSGESRPSIPVLLRLYLLLDAAALILSIKRTVYALCIPK